MAFAVEDIPDDANLFRKIHRSHYNEKTGVVSSAAFKQERMAVNWEKHKSAEDSADANSSAVVALVSRECRDLGQSVDCIRRSNQIKILAQIKPLHMSVGITEARAAPSWAA